MARTAPLLFGLLAGCAQLAGIDDTTGGSGPPAPRSLAIQRVSIGTTLVTAPQDLSLQKAVFLAPDDADPTGLARVTAQLQGVDTWTAPADSGSAVLFDLPDFPAPIQRIFDFPNNDVRGLFGVLEHPAPVAAAADAMLSVNVTLDAAYAGETLQLFSVGTWTQLNLPAPGIGATQLVPPPFLYNTMTALTGRPHERITAADSLVLGRYAGSRLSGVLAVPAFDQTGNDPITGTMSTVLTNVNLDVTIDQATAAARYAGTRPNVGNVTMNWDLRAAPGASLANNNGPLLNAAAVAMADPPKITAAYGNPFADRNWAATFTFVVAASRSYTPPALGLPINLIGQMLTRTAPSAGLTMTLPAGLPQQITLGGMALASDGMVIAKPAKAIEATFTTDKTANTLYQLQLFELTKNMAGTAVELHLILDLTAPSPSFRLPPEVWKPESLYMLRAIAIEGGYPTIADGDLTKRALPFNRGLLDGGVFQVMP